MRLPTLCVLVALALVGFSANSLLCRLALRDGAIDAGTFTLVRFVAGAAVLLAIVGPRSTAAAGSWASGVALAVYAIAFSYAYVALGAGIGAFILFAAVQATMIGGGLARGERLGAWQWLGVVIAMAGLAILTLPGSEAPPPLASAAMVAAGAAWGVYSLRGRGPSGAVAATAGNFLRSLPLIALPALALRLAAPDVRVGAAGLGLAVVSGAVTSALAYIAWYAALPHLTAARAGIVQLAVPVMTAGVGIAGLGEDASLRLGGGAAIVLGIALTIVGRRAGKREA